MSSRCLEWILGCAVCAASENAFNIPRPHLLSRHAHRSRTRLVAVRRMIVWWQKVCFLVAVRVQRVEGGSANVYVCGADNLGKRCHAAIAGIELPNEAPQTLESGRKGTAYFDSRVDSATRNQIERCSRNPFTSSREDVHVHEHAAGQLPVGRPLCLPCPLQGFQRLRGGDAARADPLADPLPFTTELQYVLQSSCLPAARCASQARCRACRVSAVAQSSEQHSEDHSRRQHAGSQLPVGRPLRLSSPLQGLQNLRGSGGCGNKLFNTTHACTAVSMLAASCLSAARCASRARTRASKASVAAALPGSILSTSPRSRCALCAVRMRLSSDTSDDHKAVMLRPACCCARSPEPPPGPAARSAPKN